MANFPPEKSILHIVSKAQIRLSVYWRALWQNLTSRSIEADARQSGIIIHPLTIPVSERYVPFQWRLNNEVGFHPLQSDEGSSTLFGYEILWNESLWAVTPFAELLSYDDKYREPLREPLCAFARREAANVEELRNYVDEALDELIQEQKIRDQLFADKVNCEMITESMTQFDWNAEPRKSLFS